MQKKDIYLDNSATTKVSQKAISAMVDAMQDVYGNPESLHKLGFNAEKLILSAKKTIALNLNCNEGEIYFTSGGTESNNIAILGAVKAHNRRGKKIITTEIEHSSVKECFEHLSSQGYEVVYIKPNENGEYHPMQFFEAVSDDTILVSAMTVNNEVGTIIPVNEIAKAVKKKNKNCLFHTDAVQAFMRVPIKLKNSEIDLMSVSGHKIGAPKGVGAFYMKKGVRISPLFYGGGQQNKIRVGTQSPELATALGAAVEEKSALINENYEHYEVLRKYFYTLASERQYIKFTKKENTVPYIINISAEGMKSEVLIHFLENYEIFVSGGSACSKGARSPVLQAMGLPIKHIDCALRISFSPETTIEDISQFFTKLDIADKELLKI